MKKYFSLLTIVILASCSNYSPYLSKKDKRNSIKAVKNYYEINKSVFNKLKKVDTTLFLLSKSINVVNKSKTLRRLDSFKSGNYKPKELILMLVFDKSFPNEDFEMDRTNKIKKPLEVKSLEKGLQKFDSFNNRLKNK